MLQSTAWHWQWFAVYLFVGVGVLIAIRLMVAKVTGFTQALCEVMAMLGVMRGEGPLLKGVLKVALFLPLAVLVWPAAVWVVVQYHFFPGAAWPVDPEAAFTCRRQHLVKVVTPVMAEAEGVVVDPLGRAPGLPFGHLNGGWLGFLAKRKRWEKLWYFEVPGVVAPATSDRVDAPSGPRMRGFAWVKGRKVQSEFVFEWD